MLCHQPAQSHYQTPPIPITTGAVVTTKPSVAHRTPSHRADAPINPEQGFTHQRFPARAAWRHVATTTVAIRDRCKSGVVGEGELLQGGGNRLWSAGTCYRFPLIDACQGSKRSSTGRIPSSQALNFRTRRREAKPGCLGERRFTHPHFPPHNGRTHPNSATPPCRQSNTCDHATRCKYIPP
jgi:hypothetical protein